MFAEWLIAAEFAAWLKVSVDTDGLEELRQEVASYVEDVRRDLLSEDGSTFAATPRIVLGAKMLGSRLWSRRSSPAGIASFAEFGPAVVLRYDPDIERLLGLGRYGRPRAL